MESDEGVGGVTRFNLAAWAVAGLALVGLTIAIAMLSPQFYYGGSKLARPLPQFIALMVAAGVIYIGTVWLARRTHDNRGILLWIVVTGLVLRAIFSFSTPICETDFYRYLWDGGVLANGYNPFAYTPSEVAECDGRVPAGLAELGSEAGLTLERVNHATLGTIYPVTAQAAFAMAHLLRPWSLGALRLVLFLFDAATLILVLLLLRHLHLPSALCAVYWWNPLLIKEVSNSAHMDVIILPFVMGALLLALRRQHIAASVMLALAVGTKLWPVILLPVILRPLLATPSRLMPALAVFAVVTAMLLMPSLASVELKGDSGFAAYAERWEMNDALFEVFIKTGELVPKLLGITPSTGQVRIISRAVAAAILLLVVALRSWRPDRTAHETCASVLIVVGALFLLSPTQFPWYCIWFIPLLALTPSYGLLSLTVMLPLYYLRFYYKARDNVGFFDDSVVWFEFAPVWGLLILEWSRARWRARKVAGHA